MAKTVMLIFGGEGAERKISDASAAAVVKRFSASRREGTELICVGITETGAWYRVHSSAEDIESGKWRAAVEPDSAVFPAKLGERSGIFEGGELREIDIALPLLHGDFGEDGIIQGALKCAHIPYVGSSCIASALTADKAYTKIIAEYLGARTVPWFVPACADMRRARSEAEARLGYPLFIKPRRLGSSIGAAPVRCRREFAAAYAEAEERSGSCLMIEALCDVAVELEFALTDGSARLISRAGAIRTGGTFYDYAAKYEGRNAPAVEPAPKLDAKLSRRARSLARRLADFFGLGALARIDFFLTRSGELFFNEINSIPGMTDGSLYPRLADSTVGGSFLDELIYEARPIL